MTTKKKRRIYIYIYIYITYERVTSQDDEEEEEEAAVPMEGGPSEPKVTFVCIGDGQFLCCCRCRRRRVYVPASVCVHNYLRITSARRSSFSLFININIYSRICVNIVDFCVHVRVLVIMVCVCACVCVCTDTWTPSIEHDVLDNSEWCGQV